jgi:uncharacterized iron-regulated protein
MKQKLLAAMVVIAVGAFLVWGQYDGSKSGTASGIQHCYNNQAEENDGSCDKRAAAFQEKYGHPYNQE